MLSHVDAVANIAVKDLEAARKFYQDTLGLKQVGAEGEELIVFKSGSWSPFSRAPTPPTSPAPASTSMAGPTHERS